MREVLPTWTFRPVREVLPTWTFRPVREVPPTWTFRPVREVPPTWTFRPVREVLAGEGRRRMAGVVRVATVVTSQEAKNCKRRDRLPQFLAQRQTHQTPYPDAQPRTQHQISLLRHLMRRAPQPVPLVINIHLWSISSLTRAFHLTDSGNNMKRKREHRSNTNPEASKRVT